MLKAEPQVFVTPEFFACCDHQSMVLARSRCMRFLHIGTGLCTKAVQSIARLCGCQYAFVAGLCWSCLLMFTDDCILLTYVDMVYPCVPPIVPYKTFQQFSSRLWGYRHVFLTTCHYLSNHIDRCFVNWYAVDRVWATCSLRSCQTGCSSLSWAMTCIDLSWFRYLFFLGLTLHRC